MEVIPHLPYLRAGKDYDRRERRPFPSLFPMMIDTQVQTLEKMLSTILSDNPEYFLVEVKIRPTNNIKVFLDGDKGISIERCVAYNRQLYKMIEETGLFPADDFSLELSSPGLDEPLKLFRQYRKNVGRKVEALLNSGIKVEGILKEVSEQSIKIEETKGKNKKQEIIEHEFPFETIKSTTIQVVF